jgi:hypothetical protein
MASDESPQGGTVVWPPEPGLPACDEHRFRPLIQRRRNDEPPSFGFGYRELDGVVYDPDVGD